jgi:hypothetical protein
VALPAAVVVLLGATPLRAAALQAVECGILPLLAMAAVSSSIGFRVGR